MASSTSAYSDETEALETHNCKSKDPTIIQSKITVISEKKKARVSTKFSLPQGQNAFLAMRTVEAFFDKVQKLSE